MKTLLLSLLLLFAGAARAETVLATARGDFNGDGRRDSLAVVMTAGRLVHDTEAWCGAGRRYEGRFVLRVRLAGRPAVDTDLNRLMDAGDGEQLAFPARKWSLLLSDYSGNGRPEFTLGQYASCNGWRYRLFAVSADGGVTERRVDDGQTLFLAARDPSVRLPIVEGGFEQRYYDNTKAAEVIRYYRWDADKQAFVLR